jgi:uncharacterized protein (TIGR02246 family)
MDLEQRIRRLEDRAAISDLVVSYFLASDDDDSDGVAASFTADATFSSSGQRNATGRDDIVAFIKTARSHMGLTVHTPNYVQCRFESDDRATGLVGAHLELVLGSVSVFGAVRYVDNYVRDDGVWRFAARDMRTVHIAPWSDVGEAFASKTPVRWPGTQGACSDYPRKS